MQTSFSLEYQCQLRNFSKCFILNSQILNAKNTSTLKLNILKIYFKLKYIIETTTTKKI